MKLLLDTTYLLPAIGVSIKGVPDDSAIQLIERGHRISISGITIFELSAVGAKQIALGNLTAERVSRGIRAVVHDDGIERVPIQDTSVLLTAFKLRRTLSDFIDCLILSSAINRTDALVTEDRHIRELRGEGEFQALLQTINPTFEIRTLKDVP